MGIRRRRHPTQLVIEMKQGKVPVVSPGEPMEQMEQGNGIEAAGNPEQNGLSRLNQPVCLNRPLYPAQNHDSTVTPSM